MASLAREVASTIAPAKSKEIFQDENCINYSNCLKEYLDRLLLGLTDKVKEGVLTYKQGVEIMYHWNDEIYEDEIKDLVRREPNIELLHKYTCLRFFQYSKTTGVSVPFRRFLPVFIKACAKRPEIPAEYFQMDLINRKILIGDILRKCLRSSSSRTEEPEVQKVDASKREVSLAASRKSRKSSSSQYSRRSFKVPEISPGDSVSVAPARSVLSHKDTESNITKSVMNMFNRTTKPE